MKYKNLFDQGDNIYYQIIEADNVKQAHRRFASQCVREDDFTFMAVGVEKCENQQ